MKSPVHQFSTVCCSLLLLSASAGLGAPLSYDADFEDQTMGGFKVEGSPGNEANIVEVNSGARSGTHALQLQWKAANYAGTRSSRGIELAGVVEGTRAKGESWFGFSIKIPSEGFPADKDFIFAQLIAWHPACETNKTIALSVVKNQVFVRAYFKPVAGPHGEGEVVVDEVVLPNPPRDQWIDVVIHSKLSQSGTGFLRVWMLDDPALRPRLDKTGINLGGGCFDGQESMTYGVYAKVGMYNYDVANFTPNESREIWFDAVRFINQGARDGFQLVHPAQSPGNGGPSPELGQMKE